MIRALLCLSALTLAAQGPPPLPLPAPAPSGKVSSNPLKEVVRADLAPTEVGTPEALTESLYAFISGPKDQKRNVEKIRALFHLQARIMVAARHPEKGPFLRPMDLESFLSFAPAQWEQTGFFERGTGLTVQKQDGLAQVWSPYEIRLAADGPAMFTGINAIQCAWDGKRWWITHLEFQSTPTAALQAKPPEPAK
ncbi:MAG: hypothetical protein ACOYNX_00005 [Geothrix sp.]